MPAPAATVADLRPFSGRRDSGRTGARLVTVRLADSLPAASRSRFREFESAPAELRLRSAGLAGWQRHGFRLLEMLLHADGGSCRLRDPQAAAIVVDELDALAEWDIAVPHFTVMPNHWHALLVPGPRCGHACADAVRRLKGRTAASLRRLDATAGPVWESAWTEQHLRHPRSWAEAVALLRRNPVLAGLARPGEAHPWTR